MKKINYFLFFILLTVNIIAQNKPQMNVQTKNNGTIPIILEDIVDITFTTTFTCGTSTIDYGGKTYHTVQIGSQCWLKENLEIGDMIQSSIDMSDNGIIEKYCYDSNPANCGLYGGLYKWNEVMQYGTSASTQGICPSGWHIPTKEEFDVLNTTVSGNSNALKAVGQGTGSGLGTNTSGFSALIAGYRQIDGTFSNLGINTFMWSSTMGNQPYRLWLQADDAVTHLDIDYETYGMSVRCIKD
ncbi:MAG: FISUMP domain-containing protein [Ignavibacteriaceae bacterium]|jgi:uncharacterized protein (TIGR02145 family)